MRRISDINPPLPEGAQKTLDVGTFIAADVFNKSGQLEPVILALKDGELEVITFAAPFTLASKERATVMIHRLRATCEAVAFISEAWSGRLTLEQARLHPTERSEALKLEVVMILLHCGSRTLQIVSPILRAEGQAPRLDDWEVRLDTGAGDLAMGAMAVNPNQN